MEVDPRIAAVEGAPGGAEKDADVLEVVVHAGVDDVLHPGGGGLLPPAAVEALVVAELDDVVELVGQGDPQGVKAAAAAVARADAGAAEDGVLEVVLDLEVAGSADPARDGIGEAVAVRAAQVGEVDVDLVAAALTSVARGFPVAELLDLHPPGAVGQGHHQVDVVGKPAAVVVNGIDGVRPLGVEVDAEVAGGRDHLVGQRRPLQGAGEEAAGVGVGALLRLHGGQGQRRGAVVGLGAAGEAAGHRFRVDDLEELVGGHGLGAEAARLAGRVRGEARAGCRRGAEEPAPGVSRAHPPPPHLSRAILPRWIRPSSRLRSSKR